MVSSHRLPLPAIEPADDSEEQQLESRDVDHERQLMSRTRQGIVPIPSILSWDTTASLRAVGELLGHQTMQMTMRYAHLSPRYLSNEVRLLDDVGSSKRADAPLADEDQQTFVEQGSHANLSSIAASMPHLWRSCRHVDVLRGGRGDTL